MSMKLWALTMGVGAAVGAVAILAMPRQNPARQLASQAADTVEDAVSHVGSRISRKMNGCDC